MVLTVIGIALSLMVSKRNLSSASSRRQFHKVEKLVSLTLYLMDDSSAATVYFNFEREIRNNGVFSLYDYRICALDWRVNVRCEIE